MNRKRYPYTKPLFLLKAGTGVEDIKDEIVKLGRELVLTNIAVEDETTGLTYVRIGKLSAGKFIRWEEQKGVPAAEIVYTTEEKHLRTGERFVCKINGGAASDKVHVDLDGYWMFTSKTKEK